MRTLFLILASALSMAQDHDHDAHGKQITLNALVVDTGCYLSHDTKGEKHIACATACAKAGVPLALLDQSSGALYMPVASDHQNQNAKLMPFIEKNVKVTGTLVEKGGLKGIVLKTVATAK